MNATKTNNQFANKLNNLSIISSVVENELKLSIDTLQQISQNLEIGDIEIATPLYAKEINITLEMVRQLNLDKSTSGVSEFLVWGLITKSSFFLLIGTKIQFFKNKQVNNPFQEEDDFELFAAELQKHFGLNHAKFYVSEGGFYFTIVEIDSVEYSFFLYKV